MKNRMMAMVILACLFTMIALPAMAANKTATSTAKIKFIAGELEFDADINGKLTGMDMDFDTQALPSGKATYEATAKSYVLTIWDQRAAVGNWKVQVKLGDFKTAEATAKEFTGIIKLSGDSTCTSETNPNGWVEGTLPHNFVINSQEKPLVKAKSSLANGQFKTTWANCEAELTIDAENAAKVFIGIQYTAELTWKLLDV